MMLVFSMKKAGVSAKTKGTMVKIAGEKMPLIMAKSKMATM
jgi:hypothetical protein